MTMFERLFGGHAKADVAPEAPPATRIYAIGDIHGRFDLLRQMHRMIAEDASDLGEVRKVLVYLGDYVDRGSSSRQVIDHLLEEPLPQFDAVYLSGNHEEMRLAFLDDASVGPMWMFNGGDATLLSYGVGPTEGVTIEQKHREMQIGLHQNLPRTHLEFLRSLKLYHVENDYLFVHAGLVPGQPIETQSAEDLLWIREEFIDSEADHGKCVVHGHTIVAEPDIRANRIAIDTGAYFSNTLSCLILDGSDRRFLQT